MATKRTKYVLVQYGRSTLLCRAMAGSATLTAVGRFDHESEARTVLDRCNAGDESAVNDAEGRSSGRVRLAG